MLNLHKFLIWLLLITGILVSALPRQTSETRSNDLHGQQEEDDVAEVSAQFRGPDRESGTKTMDKDQDQDHDKHTCGGGCSRAKDTSRGHWRRPIPTPRSVIQTVQTAGGEDSDYDDLAFQPSFRPRPIYGLLGDIIETARHGLRVDRPRAHILF